MKNLSLQLDAKLVEAIDESAWKNRTTRVQELRNVLSNIYLNASSKDKTYKEELDEFAQLNGFKKNG